MDYTIGFKFSKCRLSSKPVHRFKHNWNADSRSATSINFPPCFMFLLIFNLLYAFNILHFTYHFLFVLCWLSGSCASSAHFRFLITRNSENIYFCGYACIQKTLMIYWKSKNVPSTRASQKIWMIIFVSFFFKPRNKNGGKDMILLFWIPLTYSAPTSSYGPSVSSVLVI